jgi:predicted CoA-substrate-specific enzyme activase
VITAGIDVGTRFVKVCVVRDGAIVGADVRELNGTFSRVLRDAWHDALLQAGLFGFQVRRRAVTGFGANLVPRADAAPDEALCAASAVSRLVPEARTVIDAGALFVRACALTPDGRVTDRAVTEKCAAGSGRFLDMIASSLRVPREEVADVAAAALDPYRMSNSCAVFAESEVISRLNAGVPGPDLLAGILISIAEKAQTLFEKTEARGPVVLVGGLGHNPFFVDRLRACLGHDVRVAGPDPQLTLAFGAALVAAGPGDAHARARRG